MRQTKTPIEIVEMRAILILMIQLKIHIRKHLMCVCVNRSQNNLRKNSSDANEHKTSTDVNN